jgi:DNA-binding MarR family transcriptional regulator
MNEQQTMTETERAAALAAELRVLVGKLRRRLREQTPQLGDLTWSQVAVLGRLEREGPATVTTLARAESMRPQSMGAIVSALEGAGFVIGSPDPDDRRQTRLSVTAASREWLKASRTAREDWLSRAIQTKLAPKEREELTRAVALLHRLVES